MNNAYLGRMLGVALSVGVLWGVVPMAPADDFTGNPTLTLAVELAKDGDHHSSAIEFRRLALSDYPDEVQGSCFWMAAYEYWRNNDSQPVADILDQAETKSPDLYNQAMLLRGEAALMEENSSEAVFYLESVANSREISDEPRQYAGRRMAAIHMQEKNTQAAITALENVPGDHMAQIEAIQKYALGRDKKPLVGGLMGIIPGFGYFYAGEWANGFRSIILNGIFIWGMAETAQDDQWGLFTVVSFFELTWYTGSIYGGIDASHRYNRRRLDACIQTIEGHSAFAPEYKELPVLTLQFTF